MKKHIAIFLAGCICGALLLGAVVALRALDAYIKKDAERMKAWENTEVYSDAQVRAKMKKSGIELPSASWDLFYATSGGFQDHATWIALTVPRDQVWGTIEASLHKTKEDFKSGIPEMFLEEVEMSEDQKIGPKIDTSLWNPVGIKNPVHFSIQEKSYYEDWVVDEEGGRIFVRKQNT